MARFHCIFLSDVQLHFAKSIVRGIFFIDDNRLNSVFFKLQLHQHYGVFEVVAKYFNPVLVQIQVSFLLMISRFGIDFFFLFIFLIGLVLPIFGFRLRTGIGFFLFVFFLVLFLPFAFLTFR